MASSKRAGVTPDDWQALKTGDYSRSTEAERAALQYAEKLTKASAEITDPDVEALKMFFSEPQILDIHLLAGRANLTNRFTDPLGLELEMAAEKI